MELAGDANDWYFVAMAYQRLGHKEEARMWFEKAVAWQKEHAANDAQLAQFEKEAREVVGIAANAEQQK